MTWAADEAVVGFRPRISVWFLIGGIVMSKNFAMKAAVGVVALMVATVALEGQANAFFKLFKHHGGGCGCAAEASCGCAAEVEPSCGCAAPVEEPSCAAEPSCGCPVVEESCGCPAEPSCGCSSGCGGRKFKLFGRLRHRGGDCGCESSCGAPAECGCGAPAEPACGAPAAAPADNATPPAPEAPAA